MKGVKKPPGFGAKIAEINRHRIFSKATRAKMSKIHKGKVISLKQRVLTSKFMKQQFKNPDFKKKALQNLLRVSGPAHPNWKGGISLTKEYRAQHSLLSHRRRRNLKLGIGGLHSEEEWEELKKKYDYKCLCCGLYEPDIKLSRDHIIPISRGGSDSIENIQPLCTGCNSKKHNKIINYIFVHV